MFLSLKHLARSLKDPSQHAKTGSGVFGFCHAVHVQALPPPPPPPFLPHTPKHSRPSLCAGIPKVAYLSCATPACAALLDAERRRRSDLVCMISSQPRASIPGDYDSITYN